MTDVATFLSGHKPRRQTVALCPDSELLEQIESLRAQALQLAKADDEGTLANDRLGEVNGRLETLRERAEDSQYRFTVQSIGRSIWSALADAHQPDDDTREQYRKHGARLDWDPNRFPPAAIAASLAEAVAPDGTALEFDPPRMVDGNVEVDTGAVELARRVWDEFEFGETTRLWAAVNALNTGVSQVPKSVTVSGRTRTSTVRSAPQEAGESPDLSSSDGGSLAG